MVYGLKFVVDYGPYLKRVGYMWPQISGSFGLSFVVERIWYMASNLWLFGRSLLAPCEDVAKCSGLGKRAGLLLRNLNY